MEIPKEEIKRLLRMDANQADALERMESESRIVREWLDSLDN